jgi:tetratricopeptide (TPR) repeat protein
MQQQFVRGNYSEVIARAQKEVANDRYESDWRQLLVKSLLTVGRYDEAYTNAMEGLDGYSATIAMRLLARDAALYHNDVAGANRRLVEIKALIQQTPATARDPEQLVALGRALLLLGVEPRLVLENCFQQAEKLDSPPREAFLAAGGLALDKHDFALAATTFRAGLKAFPEDPDLEAGLARAFESGDRQEMLKALEAALAVNPRHIPSLLLLVDHLIDGEQYDDAEKNLAVVLSVNPHQPEALAYRAVLANLRNDSAQEAQCRAGALAYYQTNPEVDYLIGHKLSQKYRFAEGAAAQRRALAFEPDDPLAREELAEDLLRLADHRAGSPTGWVRRDRLQPLDPASANDEIPDPVQRQFLRPHDAAGGGPVRRPRPGPPLPGPRNPHSQVRCGAHPADRGGHFSRAKGLCRADVRHAGQSGIFGRLFRLRDHGQQPGLAGAQPGELGGRALA